MQIYPKKGLKKGDESDLDNISRKLQEKILLVIVSWSFPEVFHQELETN